ncbi:MAG: PQQ-binding-like beta-propeller repeat protein [Verrucomicrobiota bacterium]|jgi:outer membrane protein assembly factor BamB
MKNRTLLQTAMVSGLLLASALSLPAQDWPQWRGPNRDAKVDGFKAPKTWPAQLTQKWKQTVGLGDTTPALVGDKLFVFSRVDAEENVICLNAADGKEIWRQKYEAPQPAPPAGQQHAGPRSSPAVADGKVVTFGVTGILSCWNAADGKQLWQKKDATTWPRFYTGSSPLIADGMCVVQVGGSSDGGVAAYDLKSGDEKWHWTGAGPGYSSPAVMTVAGIKIVVALTDKSIVGIGLADGKMAWQTPFAAQGMNYNAATPIVDGDTLIYAGAGRGVHAVKVAKQGDAFATSDLWTAAQVSPQFSTAVLKDGFLYGLTQRGNLFCVNAKTGEVAWTDTDAKGPQGYGSVVDAGSVLLALTPKMQLVVLQPTDKAYTEVASIKVADSATFAYPVVSGNRLFIRDHDSVALLTVESP